MGDDSRRQHRLGVELEMRVSGTDCSGLHFEEATSSDDVSRGGCSFHTSHELKIGSELELEILRPAVGRRPPTPFLTKGVVLRAIDTGAGQYTVGVQFTGPHFPTYSSETTTGA